MGRLCQILEIVTVVFVTVIVICFGIAAGVGVLALIREVL